MYAKVNIDKQGPKTTIVIRPQKSVMFKIGLVVLTMIIFPGILLGVGSLVINEDEYNIGVYITFIGVIILSIFIYKHLRGVFRKEVLIIENKKLIFSNSFLGLGKYFETNLNDLKGIKYVGYEEQTKHPLDIKGDVFGFGTQQGEINYLNQEGTIMLATEFYLLRFGIDVDEEDYLKIKYAIE